MEKFILDCYEEFKKFMNIKNDILPNISPVPQIPNEEKDKKSTYAYINNDEIENNPINLYFSEILCKCHISFQKAILFHEFTHIFDGITMLSSFDKNNLNTILATYSEYHASQIELGFKIGFKNARSCYKINLSKAFIYNENQKVNVETDYLHPASDALAIIDKPNDAYYSLNNYDYYQNYKNFEVKTMYYLGKKNLCKKYSLNKFPDLTSNWYGEFYPCIQEIEQCILDKDFNKLILARKGLFCKYFSTFTYHNLSSLLEEVSFL